MMKILHTSILYLLSFALDINVNQVQGILDLSIPIPTYAIEYQGHHIKIFKDSSVESEPTFYYTPACILYSNVTTSTNPRYLTIKIGLWDEEYTSHIKSHVIRRTGIDHPDIRPVPHEWMRIDSIDHWQIGQFGTKWKSIANHPNVVSFRIRCWTDRSCNEMAASLAIDGEHFAPNIQLAFSHRLPDTTKSTVRIQKDHLLASQTFQTLNSRYPEASFVYIQNSDFDDLVQEVLKESVISLFQNDEFVDDEQIGGVLRELSRKLHHNITSTAQFTESMWNITFWTDESQRPDMKAKVEFWCIALGALREKTDLGVLSIWVTKRTADYLTAAHFVNGNSAEPRNSLQGSRADALIHSAKYCTRAHERSGYATWLMRDADNLWSLNHTLVAAALRYVGILDVSACQVQELTGTTNSFGEISLLLPKRDGLQLAITFEVAGYFPITLRNVQLDRNLEASDTFMEPLLFISRRFTTSGTAAGRLRDVANGPVLPDVKLNFRNDMNSHSGNAVESMTTSADGTWSVTLPVGHYTMTATKSGYITVSFTVVIVGGKSRPYAVEGLSPVLDNGGIRIVSLGGGMFKYISLPVHVRGPVEYKSERAHTYLNAQPPQNIPGSFVRYEIDHWEIQTVLIEKSLAGVYRISVSDWQLIRKFRTGTLWDLANSGGTVQLYTGNRLWAQYFMPNRMGNAWSVVEINGTLLKTINEMNTVTDTEDVC